MSKELILNEHDVMLLIEGALKTIVSDKEYFYDSRVGPQYSKLSESGEEFLSKTMKTLLPLLAAAHREELDRRAKELVVEQLKG